MILSGIEMNGGIAGLTVLSSSLKAASLDLCVAEIVRLSVIEVDGGAGMIVLSTSLK